MDGITELERFDPATFWSELHHRAPVIVRGGASAWPAARWTPSYLRQHYGSTLVTIRRYTPSDTRGFLEQCIEDAEELPLREFVDRCLSDEVGHWSLRAGEVLFGQHPALLQELAFESLLGALRGSSETLLWIGPKGYVTSLHADTYELNILAHLAGEKEFLFYAPDDKALLYLRDMAPEDSATYSHVDPFQLDEQAFPLFRDAKEHRVIVHPGDLLYVPRDWWHAVRSLTPSVSVTWALHGLQGIPPR